MYVSCRDTKDRTFLRRAIGEIIYRKLLFFVNERVRERKFQNKITISKIFREREKFYRRDNCCVALLLHKRAYFVLFLTANIGKRKYAHKIIRSQSVRHHDRSIAP